MDWRATTVLLEPPDSSVGLAVDHLSIELPESPGREPLLTSPAQNDKDL